MQCKDIMTKNIVCCEASESIQDAAALMLTEDIGSILICDNKSSKKLRGILTDRDIVLKVVAQGKIPSKTIVEEIMTLNPATCTEDDDIETALNLMEENQIRRIPVVDSNECIIGIISQGDVATRINDSEKTAEVVREVSKDSNEQYVNRM